MSGLSKMLDPWGFVFKIEDYLTTWGLSVPRTLNLTGAIGLSAFEFIAGIALLTGCFRRVTPWLTLLCMCFMLPLSFYIWIKNPVEDCGCFGEFWVISNFATFAKNIVITLMVMALLRLNRSVPGLFHKSIQWIVGISAVFYILTIGLTSYLVQPLVDFRPFPEGKSLIATEDDEESDNIVFIYEKDGVKRDFSMNNLPTDDEWVFVERKGGDAGDSSLTVYDAVSGDEVTEDAIPVEGPALVLVMSEPARADLSDTYAINELQEAVVSRGGQMLGLLATGNDGIDKWLDLSMGTYPCYEADDTQLKELVRGVMAMVYLEDGIIKWKRTISSIDLAKIDKVVSGEAELISLGFDGRGLWIKLSIALLAVLSVLYVGQIFIVVILKHRRRSRKHGKTFHATEIKSEKSCVNLQSETTIKTNK